jgi:hypothetical protein
MSHHAADAEAVVRSALATGANVEFVSGIAAQRLDRAGGVAAALRYVSSVATPTALALDSA